LPIYLFGCEDCGAESNLFIKVSDYDSADKRCQSCESSNVKRLYTSFATVKETPGWADCDPLERKMHLDNKRYLESRAEDILSGALEIVERGPKEFRPQVPEHLKKRHY